jgi:hypothetical protein
MAKVRAVIDRRIPPEQISDAHRYVDTGCRKGNVAINLILPAAQPAALAAA